MEIDLIVTEFMEEEMTEHLVPKKVETKNSPSRFQ